MILALLVTGAVLGPAQDSAALRDAERAFAARVARGGLAAAVEEDAAADAVLLYGGAPVLVERDRAVALLAAQPLLDSLALGFRPADVWISAAGDFGVSHGFLDVTPPAGPSRQGTYIAGWRRDGTRWRLIGLMVGGVAPPDRTVLRADPMELASLPSSGPAAAMIRADLDFSDRAGRDGAAAAFTAFAAPDAVVLGADGPQRGPEAVGASIGRGPPADWRWHPVAARVSVSGDLGFTVGQAVIQPRSGGDPSLSKYLTVWRLQSDGTMRFLTDGGNPRPRP